MNKLGCSLLIPLLVGACGSSDESHSKVIRNQIGRFTIVPAQNNYPALVLDTATGCVMTVASTEGQVSMDEVNFDGGQSSCHAMKQLLVIATP